MSKIRKPVELDAAPRPSRPSRIRREPPGRVPEKTVNAYPTEREAWTVAIGVIVFALALTVIILGISDWMSR